MSNFNIELCPIVNKGKAIQKTLSIQSISTMENGFGIPLQPVTCSLSTEATYNVPLSPTDCNPFKDGKMGNLKWEQEMSSHTTAFGPLSKPTNYWIFSCSIPQGFSEGTCSKCFGSNSAVFLYGNLGFNGGSLLINKNKAEWRIHRDNLPFPGEMIFAVMVIPGDGSMLKLHGSCAYPDCGAPGSDCMWSREVNTQTSGNYWTIASTYFATPTWTGGYIADYYTDDLGWAVISEDSLVFPDCSIYGDDTLKYKINVEGEIREVNASDFAGYGIGTFVVLKKLGVKYSEPFSDSCLGVDKGAPAESIGEEIGVSDGTFSPLLSALSRIPIDESAPIVVDTKYDVYFHDHWIRKDMTVNVAADGTCSGDCSSGKLNTKTGKWSQNIVWNNIPNAEGDNWTVSRWPPYEAVRKTKQMVMTIFCNYTKAKEASTGVVIVPWHIMGMGG